MCGSRAGRLGLGRVASSRAGQLTGNPVERAAQGHWGGQPCWTGAMPEALVRIQLYSYRTKQGALKPSSKSCTAHCS